MIGTLIIIMINGAVIFNSDFDEDVCKKVAAKLRESSQVNAALCVDYDEEKDEVVVRG